MRDGWMRVVVGCAALVRVVGCGSDFATAGDSSETDSSESGSTSSAESMDPSSVSDTLGQTQTSGPPTSDGSTSSDGTSSGEASSTSEDAATASSSGTPPPFCGDGAVDDGEECDDGDDDDTNDCTTACTIATCGDGFVWAGVEECDDANDVVTDDCPADCVAAFCGDGFIHVGVEECDDVNDEAGDGCLAGCVAENAYVYLTRAVTVRYLYRYSVDDDAWEIIDTSAWGADATALAYLAGAIHWLDTQGRLWIFDLTDASIDTIEPSPGSPFEGADWQVLAAEGRLYAFDASPATDGTDIYVFEVGTWSSFHVDVDAGLGGTWDPIAHELYLNQADGELGFSVLDTTTHAIVRSFATGMQGEGSTGAYVGGAFYNRLAWGTLQRFDAQDGTHEDTGVSPTATGSGLAAPNLATGKIYLTGYHEDIHHFEVYDTLDGSLTTLTSPPLPEYASTGSAPMVLVYPTE